jgi:hypothetical protein
MPVGAASPWAKRLDSHFVRSSAPNTSGILIPPYNGEPFQALVIRAGGSWCVRKQLPECLDALL